MRSHDICTPRECKQSKESPAYSSKTPGLDLLLGPEEVSHGFPTLEELETYFADKPVARESNCLSWWKENSFHFVLLG